MSTYTQLTHEQRYQIYALMKAKHTQTDIAQIVGVHKSTICRELRRNKGLRGYRPKQAHMLATHRRQNCRRIRISSDDWRLVEQLIRMDWSPEQISLWLRKQHRLRISHEWIYHYILLDKRQGGDLHSHLRCQKKRKSAMGHTIAEDR